MIGIVGTGKMGGALINGAVSVFGKDKVTFFEPSAERTKEIVGLYDIVPSCSNNELASKCDIILLAVKPQVFDKVLLELKPVVSETSKTIISIAPGITVSHIQETLSLKNVVRVMPNTPALIGEGMAAVSFAEDFDGLKAETLKLLESVGRVTELPESLMNAAVVANGSSPAFVYMFIEAMADGAVKYGIPRDKAYEMVAQTVLGSAKMVLETHKHPGQLKDDVCSPGGTTICGVAALEEGGFRNAVIKGCDAVYDKTVSMAK